MAVCSTTIAMASMFVHRAELWPAADSRRAAKIVQRLCQAAGQLYAASDHQVLSCQLTKKPSQDLLQIQGVVKTKPLWKDQLHMTAVHRRHTFPQRIRELCRDTGGKPYSSRR